MVSTKQLLAEAPRLLEDPDKTVREETKQLLVEVARWIGPDAMKPQISQLRAVIVAELEGEFAKFPQPFSRPLPTRFLRSQAARAAELATTVAAADAAAAALKEPAAIDPFDLLDSADVLSKIPTDFSEKMEVKKWQERKETLEAVQKSLQFPRLKPGDYSDLVKVLKRVALKDANVMIVQITIQSITALARGLRKDFSSHVPSIISEVYLEKLKDKKLTAALRESMEALLASSKAQAGVSTIVALLEALAEEVVPALESKTPLVRSETVYFLARAFELLSAVALTKKIIKLYGPALIKTLNDPAPEVLFHV